jgi:hypothetical protein
VKTIEAIRQVTTSAPRARIRLAAHQEALKLRQAT